jgi:3-oxoacyl-[acyl-carrier protein] reductase
MSDLLLFGISGQIGSEICKFFSQKNKQVIGVSRSKSADAVEWDVFEQEVPQEIKNLAPFKAVCFAQGANLNDSIYDFDQQKHLDLYKANSLYILAALSKLLNAGSLEPNSKICIISSIWQNIARQNKLSYCVSKAALQGLVNSLAVDLAKDGHLINAILPGALDTKMTLANLSEAQLEKLKQATFFNKLPKIQDVAALSYFLCSEENSSITGQFINVDLGFENAKIV